MNKKTLIIPIIAILALTGCNSKDTEKNTQENTEELGTIEIESTEDTAIENTEDSSKSVKYDSKDIDKLISLGEYKHVINISADEIAVSDEEVEEQMKSYLSENDKDENSGTVKSGDTINVDYAITIGDNVMSYSDIDITIGEDIIAPGVDETLIGQETGYTGTANIIYPEGYFDSNMVGKAASIDVTINYICSDVEEKEITDDLVKTSSNGKYNTVEELRQASREIVENSKKSIYYYDILEKVKENSKITGDISSYVDDEYENSLQEYEDYCIYYNTTMEETAKTYGYEDEDSFKEYLKTSSEDYVKEKLVIYKLAKDLNITVSEEEYNQYVDELKEQYTEEEIESLFSESYGKYVLLYGKVLNELVDLQIN